MNNLVNNENLLILILLFNLCVCLVINYILIILLYLIYFPNLNLKLKISSQAGYDIVLSMLPSRVRIPSSLYKYSIWLLFNKKFYSNNIL